MDFLRNLWAVLAVGIPNGERFLLIVMAVMAGIDLLAGNLIYAAIEAAVVAAAVYMSYNDLAWFADNEDDFMLEDAVDLMLENEYVKDVIASEILKVGASAKGDVPVYAIADLALNNIRINVIEGR